jgi:hypothetical protein
MNEEPDPVSLSPALCRCCALIAIDLRKRMHLALDVCPIMGHKNKVVPGNRTA